MRTTPWFRLYTEILDDVKVQSLSGEHFKLWVNLLALAKLHDGVLPSIEEIAFRLRIDSAKVERGIRVLDELIEKRSDGRMEPHNWNGRQFISDNATERVRRFRERSRNVSVTADETAPDTDTETESETESETDSDSEAETAKAVLAKPPNFKQLLQDDIDGWPAFCEAWTEAGAVKASTSDWNLARGAWRFLSHEQREAARSGILARKGSEDAALSALPINYIRRSMWERGIRQNGRKTSRVEQIFDELDQERGAG